MPCPRRFALPVATILAAAVLISAVPSGFAAAPLDCSGNALPGVGGKGVRASRLADGSVAAYSGMNINIDGYARAYHPKNRAAGAVLHLCVGAKVWLPDGSAYEGSESQATCTGKFMADLARIEAAGWADPSVGLMQWYGVAAQGSAKIGGRTVQGIRPLLQKDGSGFYVSPTSLVDKTVTDLADQRRYVNPLRVASAVVPSTVVQAGVRMGSFGVAVDGKRQVAVPFIVGDGGPRVGEGSPALARQVAGLPLSDDINLKNRYEGQVDGARVLWVYFGGSASAFDHTKEGEIAANARVAFDAWGGDQRLAACLAALPKP